MGVPLQEPPATAKSGSLSTGEAPELELRVASRAGSEKQTADEALEAARKRIDLPWVLSMITYMISLYGIYVAWFVILLSIANAVRGTDFLVIQYRSKSRPVVPDRTGSQLPPWLLIADTLTASV